MISITLRPHHLLPLCALLALAGLAGAGCGDDGGAVAADGGAETPFVAPDVETEYTDWPPVGATTALPAYGKGCRYRAVEGSLFESATNGAPNDELTLAGPVDGPASAAISVRDADGLVLEASVDFADRTLPKKGFHEASGTATWGAEGAHSGTIVHGAICFADQLVPDEDVDGEFSLILEDSAGVYHTVGGAFELPGEAVTGADPIAVDAGALDIDLR